MQKPITKIAEAQQPGLLFRVAWRFHRAACKQLRLHGHGNFLKNGRISLRDTKDCFVLSTFSISSRV
jgi:hypothetical protein